MKAMKSKKAMKTMKATTTMKAMATMTAMKTMKATTVQKAMKAMKATKAMKAMATMTATKAMKAMATMKAMKAMKAMPAVKTVTVGDTTYELPCGMTADIAVEQLSLKLPAQKLDNIFVGMTRVEACHFKVPPLAAHCLGMTLSPTWGPDGMLRWSQVPDMTPAMKAAQTKAMLAMKTMKAKKAMTTMKVQAMKTMTTKV